MTTTELLKCPRCGSMCHPSAKSRGAGNPWAAAPCFPCAMHIGPLRGLEYALDAAWLPWAIRLAEPPRAARFPAFMPHEDDTL